MSHEYEPDEQAELDVREELEVYAGRAVLAENVKAILRLLDTERANSVEHGEDAWRAVAVAWQAGYRAGCEDEKRDRGPVGGEGGPSTRNPYLTYDEWGNASFEVRP